MCDIFIIITASLSSSSLVAAVGTNVFDLLVKYSSVSGYRVDYKLRVETYQYHIPIRYIYLYDIDTNLPVGFFQRRRPFYDEGHWTNPIGRWPK